ncbi:phospholipase A and acyltransferase 3-like isoform X4 [Biomphalaria glabrata]|uniref:Phospholipase A and acyltransferase 3-like isoform X3 n=1 Tax=Biomphalaria glabrata TaxID=6526 RepID=A0A2C9KJP6_BIOGL|nr:phospholipase A and acyltransferase 3-like isoform X3 [Biomphalaria glabrata]XP_055897410.1 phospholipase A and acyltransferase 3-like isoform X4 [Biomphalaria glabrata]
MYFMISRDIFGFHFGKVLYARKRMTDNVSIFNEREIRKAKNGERVQFLRKGYSHWALYVGQDLVVHLWNPHISLLGVITTLVWWSTAVSVRQDNYRAVERGSRIKINRSMDKYLTPLPENTILENANRSLAANECGYNAFLYNCEHFVNKCRFGFWRYNFLSSEQILALPFIFSCFLLATEVFLVRQFISYENIIVLVFASVIYICRLQLLALLNWFSKIIIHFLR